MILRLIKFGIIFCIQIIIVIAVLMLSPIYTNAESDNGETTNNSQECEGTAAFKKHCNMFQKNMEAIRKSEFDTPVNRIADQVGISKGTVEDALSGKSTDSLKDICNLPKDTTTNNDVISCYRELADLLEFEKSLAEMEATSKQESLATEIWTNGTLWDSSFDLVTDLNVIDILYFGEDARVQNSRATLGDDDDDDDEDEVICGNGEIEGEEKCDDGNTLNEDGCSAECLLEDETDDGETEFECGNGKPEQGEVCDDGNLTNGDGCNNLCSLEEGITAGCGNGILELDEECDDKNLTTNDGCSDKCKTEGASPWEDLDIGEGDYLDRFKQEVCMDPNALFLDTDTMSDMFDIAPEDMNEDENKENEDANNEDQDNNNPPSDLQDELDLGGESNHYLGGTYPVFPQDGGGDTCDGNEVDMFGGTMCLPKFCLGKIFCIEIRFVSGEVEYNTASDCIRCLVLLADTELEETYTMSSRISPEKNTLRHWEIKEFRLGEFAIPFHILRRGSAFSPFTTFEKDRTTTQEFANLQRSSFKQYVGYTKGNADIISNKKILERLLDTQDCENYLLRMPEGVARASSNDNLWLNCTQGMENSQSELIRGGDAAQTFAKKFGENQTQERKNDRWDSMAKAFGEFVSNARAVNQVFNALPTSKDVPKFPENNCTNN